jgi:hypothetical protein
VAVAAPIADAVKIDRNQSGGVDAPFERASIIAGLQQKSAALPRRLKPFHLSEVSTVLALDCGRS